MMTLFFVFFTSSDIGYAVEDKTPVDDIYKPSYGEYKDSKYHYGVDTLSDSDLEDTSFKDIFLHPFKTLTGEGVSYVYMILFELVNIGFMINMAMTNFLVKILEIGYNSDALFNPLIDRTANAVAGMSGISNGKFTTKGLYGAFVGLICSIVAVYSAYQYVVKRAFINAASTIFKTIIAFTLALFMFSNLSTVLKGVNTVTTELTGLLLPNTISNSSGKVVSVREAMYDNIFSTFVHKPYMMLQYSTTDDSKIGKERIEGLLTKKQYSEERKKVALKEVNEYGNYTMTQKYVQNRLMFSSVMLFMNGINSIPLFILAIVLLMCHFWFIAIAIASPFALLWGALPNQFGVIQRYLFELCLPFFTKLFLVLASILLFGMTDIIYNLQSFQDGIIGYILTGLCQAIILGSVFFFRKRIMSIFILGSNELSKTRESFKEKKEQITKPIKSGVKTTASVVGGVAAGVATGGNPQAVMAGVSVGSNLGNALTGDKKLTDAINSSVGTIQRQKMLNGRKPKTNEDYLGNLVSDDFFNTVSNKNMSDSERVLHKKLLDAGLDKKQADDVIMNLRNEGLNDVSVKEFDSAIKDATNMDFKDVENLRDIQAKRQPDYFSKVRDSNMTNNERNIQAYLTANGHDLESANRTILSMRKEGLADASLEDVKQANEEIQLRATDDKFNRTPQEYFLQGLREQDRSEKFTTYQDSMGRNTIPTAKSYSGEIKPYDHQTNTVKNMDNSTGNVVQMSPKHSTETINEKVINKTTTNDNVVNRQVANEHSATYRTTTNENVINTENHSINNTTTNDHIVNQTTEKVLNSTVSKENIKTLNSTIDKTALDDFTKIAHEVFDKDKNN